VPSALLILLLASLVIFAILRLVPGDPATALAGPDAGPATVAAIRQQLGLNQPLPVQYGTWIAHLLRGDLGRSYAIGGNAASLIGNGFVATGQLTAGALLFVLVLGTAFGVLGAVSRSRWVKAAVRAATTVSLAVPPFVTGILLVLVFAVALHVLPPGGRAPLLQQPGIAVQYLLLPSLCLALPSAAVLGRYLKDSLERALAEDYARCCGGTRCRTPCPRW
jgi:peptide/nickel transport system permease protein